MTVSSDHDLEVRWADTVRPVQKVMYRDGVRYTVVLL